MRANKHLLLWTSVGTLLLLGWAAFAENFLQPWRREQVRYRDALGGDAAAAFSIQLRQVVVPALDETDRCVSCHVGMAVGEQGIANDPVLAPHPDVVHDPAEYGCTTCHGGQGRATVTADAHGAVPHWPEPMLPEPLHHAGCGTCHTHLAVPALDRLERGRALFERHDCLACHALDGRGGTLRPGGAAEVPRPDLSRVGATGYAADWYADHLEQRERADSAAWRQSFAPFAAAEREAIAVFLDSRVGAPGLVEAKAQFHSLGCRGCHPIAGVGGDDGPDLTRAGQLDPGQLDFSHVPAERDVAAWHRAHLRAPARVVPGSQMPDLGLTEEQIDALVTYLMSLRRAEVPEAFWPVDRIRAERFAAREFATDGATLYGTFCAACHGPAGQGMRYPGMPAFPSLASPDFLALADDAFIRATVVRGRPGRRMPAWGEKAGGLRPEEIDAVVEHVRRLGGDIEPRPDPRPARWVEADAELGARLYRAHCSGCHGASGQGGEGTALDNAVLLATATDTYLYETIRRGRGGSVMPAFARATPARPALSDDEIAAIVAHIRSWEETP